MSYCVNCGVELVQSEECCPLCDCPIVNPKKEEGLSEEMERPYPKRKDTVKDIMDRHFVISIISILYLLPIVICLVADHAVDNEITWSQITTVSIILFWAIIFLPFLISRKFAIIYLTIDLGLVTMLFFVLKQHAGSTTNWIEILALPIAVAIYVMINITFYGIKMKLLKKLYIGAFVLSITGLFSIMTELLIWNYVRHYFNPSERFTYWSIYVFISCIIGTALLCYVEKKKEIKGGIEKRFHI